MVTSGDLVNGGVMLTITYQLFESPPNRISLISPPSAHLCDLRIDIRANEGLTM
jgi:hypothetical protein